MIDKIIAKRYTDAYLHFVQKTIGFNVAVQELLYFRETVMRENPDFIRFLCKMEITTSDKFALIDKILGTYNSAELCRFLKVLVEKNRINKFRDILEYVRITYAHGDQVDALIKTSFLLEAETIKTIQQKLENLYHKKFHFYIELDGSLLGGIQIIIGNTIIDGSVRKRLTDLKQQLMAVRII